jgi:nuclear pore complex protein Nup188
MTVSLSLLSLGGTLGYLQDPNSTATVSLNGKPEAPFILNTKTLEALHDIMMHAADEGFVTAGPSMLAWVTILKVLNTRISSRTAQIEDHDNSGRFDPRISADSETAIPHDPYQDMMETIMDSLDEDDPIDFLARRAVNQSHVLETLNGLALRLGSTAEAFFADETGLIVRSVILDLIGSSNDGLGYIPEVVEALLSTLLGGQSYWDFVDSKQQIKAFDPIASFIDNDDWINAFFQTAVSRYPFEPQPFLRMIHAVASCSSTYAGHDPKSAMGWLDGIPFFTYQLPEDFIDYETTQEEDNNNNVRLKTPVHLFEPRSHGFYQRANSRSQALTLVDKDFCIPAGTYGRIISDSVPKVVFWFHQYSGLKYFGKLLETFLTASDLVDATTGSSVDRDSVVEIIDIFATMLQGYSKGSVSNADAQEDAQRVLELASSGLNRNRDIITVVFDIFEEELHRQSTVSGSEVPLGILVSCIHFIHALVAISPGRVWPHLAQSSLLGVNRGGGRLLTIVEGVELVLGRYEFLLACTRLYEALVEDVVANAIMRRSGSSSPARFTKGKDVGAGIPDHVLSKVLLHFTRYSTDVLESSFSWKFVTQNDRRRLCQSTTIIFDRILRYVYGIEPTPETHNSTTSKMDSIEMSSRIRPSEHKITTELASKLTGALIPSATQIVESFLSTSSSSLRFQPILVVLLDGLETPDLTIFLNELDLWTTQVTAVFSFSSTLLRVSNLLERPPTELTHQTFKAAPLIARLYAVNDIYKVPVVTLLDALIVTANNVAEPPSLLGHLGPYTAKNFLQIVSELDKPLARERVILAIWHFLSMVVSNKQQWFGNYLLTGKTPREALEKGLDGKDTSVLDKPLLTTALEKLSNIREISKVEATAMLEFVSFSQNFYSWTVYTSPKHGEFISSIAEYVGTLPPIQKSGTLDDQVESCFQTKILATIAEILAMHMFHSRQMGTPSNVPDPVENLSYYWRFGVQVPSLNSSIHFQLKQNFEARYPKCTLQHLKRTTLEERQFGRCYFYELCLGDKMLHLDEAWTGVKNSDGHRASLEKVNVNLSLVDAQVVSTSSFKLNNPH